MVKNSITTQLEIPENIILKKYKGLYYIFPTKVISPLPKNTLDELIIDLRKTYCDFPSIYSEKRIKKIIRFACSTKSNRYKPFYQNIFWNTEATSFNLNNLRDIESKDYLYFQIKAIITQKLKDGELD